MTSGDTDRGGGRGVTAPAAPNVKLHRWVDLLAALLSRALPTTFEQLARDVPWYAERLDEVESEADPARRKSLLDSLKRTFERDKEELRAFGVPIESLPDADGNPEGAYRLRHRNFYLPYLCFARSGRVVGSPRRVDRWGYRALTSLTFDADELHAVVDAAACVRGLGDPLLAAAVDGALRKLAVDLPVDSTSPSLDGPRVVRPRAWPDEKVFEALAGALAKRKLVTFQYHAMSSGRTEWREVAPYGLFFVGSHWYLAARDTARGELRNFRLNRIGEVEVNKRRPHSPDYDVPDSFHLREHARSRQSWELGDGEAATAVVEFHGTSGPAVAARRLGRPLDGDESMRVFDVRRPDAFARWLLSFAGEVAPVAPDEMIHRFRELVAATAAVYERDGDSAARPAQAPAPARPIPAPESAERVWQPQGAAAQLRRILQIIPEIADGAEHSVEEIAARLGISVATLERDVYSIGERFDAPGGFVQGVELFLESGKVAALSDHFARPMRLTVAELCALELGLAVLRTRRPPDEHAVLDRARERLRQVITLLPDDPITDLYAVSPGDDGGNGHLAAISEAVRERRKLRITYRKSGSDRAEGRVICPCVLVLASGVLYVLALCDPGERVRVFRADRIEAAEVMAESFDPPEALPVDDVLRAGRVLIADSPAAMLVRYSPRVARWIAEREGVTPGPDGSLVLEHPVADSEWAMRHVLQYGPDAELLEPAELRDALRARLGEMARAPLTPRTAR